jgi:C-8 sterol isomerase
MPSQAASHRTPCGRGCWTRVLSVLAIIAALATALFAFLDSRLDAFYIFSPSQLHDLSLRAIKAHGNDTSAVVGYIVGELKEQGTAKYVNPNEEWVFNNAGGAMGAMYIIHASKSALIWTKALAAGIDMLRHNIAGVTEYLIIFGLFDLPLSPIGSRLRSIFVL